VIVLDASVVVELLLGTAGAEAVERRVGRDPSLHAPSLLDLEVAQVIRRYCAAGQMRAERGSQAIADLAAFPVRRYPHTPLLERVWELRGGVTAYDAAYVALAETLHAPLVTRDRGLARTRGHRAHIELV
jgi:predicted nucleic acid-binding protein